MDQALTDATDVVNWADGFKFMPCKLTLPDSELPALAMEFTASNSGAITSVVFVGDAATLVALRDAVAQSVQMSIDAVLVTPDDSSD